MQIGAVRPAGVISRVHAVITPVHDKLILVTGLEHRGAVEELFPELIGYPRQVDIVDINEIELVCPPAAGVARDSIAQGSGRDRTGIFVRPALVVIGYLDAHVGGEEQSCLTFSLQRSSAISAPFIGNTSAEGEYFGAMEDILIAISESGRDAPVSGTVSTFELGRDGIESVAGDSN